MIEQSLQAFALWTGLNLMMTLLLGLNVTRWRGKEGVSVGSGTSPGLERAIRAHGNNIEYGPGALIGVLVLVALGYSALTIHVLGVLLLIARACHAYGIQQLETPLPKSRVLGNILTWLIYLVVSCLLVFSFF